MESNEIVRKEILKVVDNQLKANNPPETRQTLERLKALGYSDKDARILIAKCVAFEIYYTLKEKKPYDNHRYISNLNKLPQDIFDD
jgi:Holliday junction resolvasome RuvABC DNA-binding subunit